MRRSRSLAGAAVDHDQTLVDRCRAKVPIGRSPPASPLPLLQSQSGGRLSADQIQARVAAAASVCIEQLAEHTRRGKVGELWTLLLGEVEARVERLAEAEQRVAAADGAAADAPPATASKRARRGGKAGKVAAAEAPAGGEGAAAAAEELAAARARAARALALLAQLVEHGRGCRVEDYQPLFQLAARLARLDWPASTPSGGSSSGGAGAEGGEAPIQVPSLLRGGSSDYEDFLQPSLSAQVLRLLLALALAHARAAGASEGPAALGKAAPAWALALARAPPAELIAFTRALISPPGGQPVARPFAQQLLGALGRCLLAGEHMGSLAAWVWSGLASGAALSNVHPPMHAAMHAPCMCVSTYTLPCMLLCRRADPAVLAAGGRRVRHPAPRGGRRRRRRAPHPDRLWRGCTAGGAGPLQAADLQL